MFGVPATLTLAVVLAFAGMLGGIRGLVLRDQKNAGAGRWSSVLSCGLCVQAGRRAAQKTGERAARARLCTVLLFMSSSFLGGPRDSLRRT